MLALYITGIPMCFIAYLHVSDYESYEDAACHAIFWPILLPFFILIYFLAKYIIPIEDY